MGRVPPKISAWERRGLVTGRAGTISLLLLLGWTAGLFFAVTIYFTKIVRTSWIPPRVLGCSGELRFLLSAPAVQPPSSPVGFSPGLGEEHVLGKNPARALSGRGEDHKQRELREVSLRISSVVWPGESLRFSGLLKTLKESRWHRDLMRPLGKGKPWLTVDPKTRSS